MAVSREVVEGVQIQGEDEKIAYSITTTPWGSTPTTGSVVVKDASAAYAVVTTTVMPTGSLSILLDVITLPLLQSLTAGHTYRVEVKFTVGGNIEEAYFNVRAER
jgi:hypothetical protein